MMVLTRFRTSMLDSSAIIPVLAVFVCLANAETRAWPESCSSGSTRIVALHALIGKTYRSDVRAVLDYRHLQVNVDGFAII